MARSSSLPEPRAGLGAELALLLLSKGARVAGIDFNAAALAETARLAVDHAADFEPIEANIADRQVVEQLPNRYAPDLERQTGVINNARNHSTVFEGGVASITRRSSGC